MSRAILSGGHEAFTADLRIRFRNKVCVGGAVVAGGWMVSIEMSKILAKLSHVRRRRGKSSWLGWVWWRNKPTGCVRIAVFSSRIEKRLELSFDRVQIGFASIFSLDIAVAFDQKAQREP